MIIVLGLIILVAALVVAVAGVLANGGSAHPVSHFSVLGYHVAGSAGMLFLAGIVVGAAGLLGLSLLRADARDELIGQRDTASAYTGGNLSNGTAPHDARLRPAGHRWSRLRELRNRCLTHRPARLPVSAPAQGRS